jgi:C-terminal processing protease CtpA/Prc
MRIWDSFTPLLAVIVFADLAPAQQSQCHQGPGAAFGVTAYHCASCGIETRGPDRLTFVFHTEPIVLETAGGSGLRPGDVVVAVNGHPILTARGADAFTYPAPGESVVTVRRDGEPVRVPTRVSSDCPADVDRVESHSSDTAPRRTTDARPATSGAGPGRFGFALACKPSCTRARASNGTIYYKFDGHPPVAEIRRNGPADRAGLRVGDVVTEINGQSILQEAGVLPFLWSGGAATRVRLTVVRNGATRVIEVRAE